MNSPRVTSDFIGQMFQVPTPALVYDLDGIEYVVNELKKDIAGIPNSQLLFSVKANKCLAVLKKLHQLGLGADVASLPEFALAKKAKMNPIFATAPAYGGNEIKYLYENNVIVDFNSISQLQQWCEQGGSKEIGLRLRFSIPDSQKHSTIAGKDSRFGINPTEQKLHELIKKYDLKITQLHIHMGELRNSIIVKHLMLSFETWLSIFPDVSTLNLGGGLTYLYSDREEARRAWEIVRKEIFRFQALYSNQINLLIEPGMLLAVMSGYLVTEVRSADQWEDQKRIVSLNASAWNLFTWSASSAIAQSPCRSGSKVQHDIYGCTCYEDDVFTRALSISPLCIGDKLIFNMAGAYISSMSRNMHGYDVPREWIKTGDQLMLEEEYS